MAILTKNQLSASNASSFPDNTTGAITPQVLRDYNTNIIDTLVDSLVTSSYAQTDATNNFTTEQDFTSISASSFVSASEFVGNGSKITGITASVALPILDEGILQGYATSMNFTGSAINAQVIAGTAVVSVNVEGAGFVSTASFNAYTQSNDQKWTNIGAQSGSWVNVPLDSLNAFSASQITKDATLSNVTSSLNVFTQSQEAINLSLQSETASLQQQLTNIGTQSGSWDNVTDITLLNQFTASQNTKNSTLATYTSSVDQKFSNIGSQSGSWITESESGSFLITASFDNGTRNLTFTKGNNTTFNVNIPDVSGSTGNFATTGSNTFIGDQTISGSLFQSGSLVQNGTTELSGNVNITGSTTIKGTTNFQNSSTTITGSLLISGSTTQIGNNLLVGTSTLSGSVFVSGNIEVTNGANLITHNVKAAGSNGLDILANNNATIATMGQGGGTQAQFLGSLSANSFSASTINGLGDPLAFSTSVDSRLDAEEVSSSVFATKFATIGGQSGSWGGGGGSDLTSLNAFTASQFVSNSFFATTGSNTFVGDQEIQGGLLMSGSLGITYGNSGNVVLTQVTALGNYQTLYNGNMLFQTDGVTNYHVTIPTFFDLPVTFESSSVFYRKASFQQGIDVTGSTNINDLTASLQQGYVWVGDASGKTITVATSSFTGSSVTINTGSFATTGSNNFVGVETIGDLTGTGLGEVYLLGRSGSLILANSTATPTYSALSHISSSQVNSNTNLIFKTNTNTPDTIVSGSGNIFVNGAAPTAGFKRYIGGSNNIFNTTNLPQISGSMGFSPAMGGNIGIGSYTFRGPVSSSAWNINNNYNAGTINIGQSAVLNAEKLTGGLNITANSIQGTLNIVANQSFLTGSNTSFLNNSMNGTATLTLSSSAAAMNNNIINDSGFILTNQFYSSSVGLGVVNVNRNNIAGQSNSLTVVGALPTGTTTGTSFSDNFIGGGNNILYGDIANARVSGSSAYHNAVRNIIFGNGLIVTGSSLLSDVASVGSAFFGRFNDIQGTKDLTANTVFAVGTGTDVNRKTGFLIDSGSNTFVEGTLNVSGATSLNGDLVITGSLTASLQQGYVWVGDASGKTTTVATSSFGGGGGFPYTGNAVITGSLGISGSMFGGVVALSVVSATASVDFSAANMFTLTLPSASTHILPTNVRAGQTVNIQITQPTPGTGSVTFPSAVKFAGGNDYQATATGSAIDMLTLVSYDGSNVLGTSIKNFL